MIVLHYTAMTSPEAALERLCDPEHEVSSHYLIDQQGGTFQLVAEGQRAWHAGAGAWGGCEDVNSASIGIELCNVGDHEFPAVQMQALTSLLREVIQRWGISVNKVIGHSDMAPGRKQDPGRLFDWRALEVEGVALFRGQSHPQVLPFWQSALHFGYVLPETIGAKEAVLEAFRQRFRPQASGPLDDVDIRILSDLAQSYPVVSEA
jgi:N-acetylmuramoyl-L-alanine amidase